jgi:hypothetical protein
MGVECFCRSADVARGGIEPSSSVTLVLTG